MQTDVCIPSERGKVFPACAFSGFMLKAQGHVWKLLQPMQPVISSMQCWCLPLKPPALRSPGDSG